MAMEKKSQMLVSMRSQDAPPYNMSKN
jgi:hypothetical protein